MGLNNLLAAYTDKSADAICTFAYCEGPGCEVQIFEGICEVQRPLDTANDRVISYLPEDPITLDGILFFNRKAGIKPMPK